MIEKIKRIEDCMQQVDAFLASQQIKPISKKKFPVDDGSYGYVYQLGHFGIEITKHQFIVFSKYNSRYIEMQDYDSTESLLDYVLPIIQEYIDDPGITKHLFVRSFNKLKNRALGIANKNN